MADVEQRAEAEAAKKGLSGGARKSYIGGVFNRIRQAHARAIQPGKGKTFLSNLNRRNRQLARARYQEALRPHEEAVAELKRQRKQELAQLSYEKGKPDDNSSQIPIIDNHGNFINMEEPDHRLTEADRERFTRRSRLEHWATRYGVPIDPFEINPGNPQHIDLLKAQYHGPKLRRVLRTYSTSKLRDIALVSGLSEGGTRAQILDRLTGDTSMPSSRAAPITPSAKPPKPAPAERQRQRAIADAIQHGAPDFPPGTLAAAQGEPAAQAAESAPPIPRFKRVKLTPIKSLPGFQLDATRALDPYFIREYFGDKQLPKALAMQTQNNLAEATGVVERKTGKRYTGSRSNRAEMYHWILANM